MKKTGLSFCAFFVVIVASAQIPVGFKAGINTNRIAVRDTSYPDTDNSNAELSFHLGVFTKLKLSSKLCLFRSCSSYKSIAVTAVGKSD